MGWFHAVVATLAVAVALPAFAGQGALSERPGYAAYREYCSACHGPDATGISGVAAIGRGRPADLTRLAEIRGAPVWKPKLLSRIGRRSPFSPYWTDELSICGSRLLPDLGSGPSARAARQRIALEILTFLEGIQAGSGATGLASSAHSGIGFLDVRGGAD